MSGARLVVAAFEARFAETREQCEAAIEQLDADRLRRPLDAEGNSVAIIAKHVGGNLCSRFSGFLTSDGEKPWRDREGEFIDDLPPAGGGEAGREAVLHRWRLGWLVLEAALAALTDADLPRTVFIRGQAMSAADAMARALAHVGYHQGQIVLTARTLVGPAAWKTISVPRGGTSAFHAGMGFDPAHAGRGRHPPSASPEGPAGQVCDWQPTLHGRRVHLRPVVPADFLPLHAAASDPLVWAEHPEPTRHELRVFERYFAGALASGGGLVAIEADSGRIIGASRYYAWNPADRSVAIGYTFLERACWGTGINREMKRLMLGHAFRWAETVWFHVSRGNIRSQRALKAIGAVVHDDGECQESSAASRHITFRIDRASASGLL